ncbi:flagellar biosynthesis anti-sigma factor FlgM [Pseudoalteromonas marina]|uniref:Flagellar biosynthesis anti-sigma factor FlgM n=1 Tax=Pseudoalteromonas marina TaxID=267375 RepID=A0ABT9FC67_9GAMM|nr:flagellar biosynthesis anti-sigma factor FlgM [Pseudoalteromonas marina]MDP2564360.1 flagellar biosynthesis anti-sigma factor FlgM [Pseudoalteromonas marina]
MIIPINGAGPRKINNNKIKKSSTKPNASDNVIEAGTVISVSFNSSIEETINLKRVNELRQLIADGKYNIDAEGIAKAIVTLNER